MGMPAVPVAYRYLVVKVVVAVRGFLRIVDQTEPLFVVEGVETPSEARETLIGVEALHVAVVLDLVAVNLNVLVVALQLVEVWGHPGNSPDES